MLTLSSGEYFGGTLRSARLAGSTATLTAYSAGCECPWHVHESPTLFVLLSGRHRDESRRAAFEQPPLSVVFHPTKGPHATAVGPSGMVGINLELTAALLERCGLERRHLADECRVVDALDVRLLALRVAVLSGEPDGAADLESAVVDLVAGVVRDFAPPARSPSWLPRALEFLHARAHEPIGASDVAAELSVHPVYLARAFRRFMGCTVTSAIQALRLIEAGRLVLDERASLADAALRAGFADQAHFTRLCSRELGFTPGRLQRLRAGFAAAAGSHRSDAAAPRARADRMAQCRPFRREPS
jgi:AraC family transcriptional regulator